MKERVLKALEQLSKGDHSEDQMVRGTLVPLLMAETGLTSHEISLNATKALEMILHNYADFAIGTIDSFSHKLIRTFAHDFGLPVNFNVELDADELLSTAVDLLLDRVGDDDAPEKPVRPFAENGGHPADHDEKYQHCSHHSHANHRPARERKSPDGGRQCDHAQPDSCEIPAGLSLV